MESIPLLEGLLRQYSPTGQETGAVRYLVEVMQSLGFSAGVDEVGNAVGVKGAGPNKILLLGHIDTVPGFIEVHQGCTSDPREGDCLYGRGSVDAKGPLACFVSAAAGITPPPGWQIKVIGAVGEEGDSRGARYLVDHESPPKMVIIGEPSRWDHITLGYKGSFWLNYSIRQPMTHTAAKTNTACEVAVNFWNQLTAKANAYNGANTRAFEQLTPTLREINSSTDGFYNTAQCKINLRVPPGITAQDLHTLIFDLAGSAEIEVEDSIPPFRAEKNSPLVRAFLAAIRKMGGQPGFTLKTGTSDMNLVGPAWGCPILAYGPGDSNLDHTPEERISLSEYLAGIQVLKEVLSGLMRAPASDKNDFEV